MAATTLTDRAVIRLSGEDVGAFLQGLVTSDVSGTLPVWAGLLNPQGKCLFDFLVWTDGGDLLLDCEEASADDLVKRLAIYRLRRAIRIAHDISWRSIGPRRRARGFLIRGSMNSGGAGSVLASRPQAGSTIACAGESAKAKPSSATCYGLNAMPPS